MSKLPKPIAVQSIAGLTDDPHNYESHKRTIEAFNQLISSLGPGTAIAPQNFALSAGFGNQASITAVSGTFKRGTVTVQCGISSFIPNPTITLNFPANSFSGKPFAQVVKNGGTGTLGFSYLESVSSLVITLQGTPAASTTYTFQFNVAD